MQKNIIEYLKVRKAIEKTTNSVSEQNHHTKIDPPTLSNDKAPEPMTISEKKVQADRVGENPSNSGATPNVNTSILESTSSNDSIERHVQLVRKKISADVKRHGLKQQKIYRRLFKREMKELRLDDSEGIFTLYLFVYYMYKNIFN